MHYANGHVRGSLHVGHPLAWLMYVGLAGCIADCCYDKFRHMYTRNRHLLVQLVQDVLLFSLKLILQVHLFCVHLVALKIKLCQLQIKAKCVSKTFAMHCSIDSQDTFSLFAKDYA